MVVCDILYKVAVDRICFQKYMWEWLMYSLLQKIGYWSVYVGTGSFVD